MFFLGLGLGTCLGIILYLGFSFFKKKKNTSTIESKKKKEFYFLDHFEYEYKESPLSKVLKQTVFVLEFKPNKGGIIGDWQPYIRFILDNPLSEKLIETEVLSISYTYFLYPSMEELNNNSLREMCRRIERRFQQNVNTTLNIKQWLTVKEDYKREFARKVLELEDNY